MRVALCTRNAKNPVIALLAHFLERRESTAEIITDPRQVASGPGFDAAFWRPDSRTREIAAFSRQAAVILDALGIPFLNSLASMERAGSKLVSHTLLSHAGLNVPTSWATPRAGAHAAVPEIAGPVVVKPVWGKNARAVAVFPDAGEALRAARSLSEPTLLQSAIPWRFQYRCVMTPDRAVRVYRDESPTPDRAAVRTFNRFDAGAVDEVDHAILEMAGAMLAAVGGDLMRADILEDEDGRYWALEINSSFGFPHDDQRVLEAFLSGFGTVARLRRGIASA
jgi:glutathione synthase/RimK-type ligase-like ATP-grasp enzyme